MEKSPQPTEQPTESSASYQEIPVEDFRRIYNVERSDGTIEYGWREEGHGVTEDGLAYTRVIREIDDPRNPGQKVMAEKNVPTDKLLADHEKVIQAKREVSRRMGETARTLPLLESGEAPKLIEMPVFAQPETPESRLAALKDKEAYYEAELKRLGGSDENVETALWAMATRNRDFMTSERSRIISNLNATTNGSGRVLAYDKAFQNLQQVREQIDRLSGS